MGLARTFQQLELFSMLTVRENIRVAADIRRRWARDRSDSGALTDAIIDQVGLRAVADERVTGLPTGQGRLVELGRALACKPRVLLLDEPASGQDEEETHRFGELLVALAAEGTAVVLVEHDMALVMEVCDRVHVLDLGHMIAVGEKSGQLEQMLENVARAYDSQVETRVQAMTSLLEPLIIVFMGGGVGFIAFSILMPLIQMNDLVN
jgi:branched-chain amino acid transport system ATP-binding protein